jgi:DNA-binding XRE family transcriptional regulator
MSALERAVCDRVIEARRELQISQSQLAHVLNTHIRTVKRWERYQCKPRRLKRLLLGKLSQYVKDHGMEAFRQRFLREEGRYNKPGPAERLGELWFDSQLRPRPTTEAGDHGTPLLAPV